MNADQLLEKGEIHYVAEVVGDVVGSDILDRVELARSHPMKEDRCIKVRLKWLDHDGVERVASTDFPFHGEHRYDVLSIELLKWAEPLLAKHPVY